MENLARFARWGVRYGAGDGFGGLAPEEAAAPGELLDAGEAPPCGTAEFAGNVMRMPPIALKSSVCVL